VRFIVHGGAVLTTCANFIPRSPCALPILWAKEAGERVHGARVIGMLGLLCGREALDVHREQPRSPLCFEGLACVRCRSCLEETLDFRQASGFPLMVHRLAYEMWPAQIK
jgi:hypothetical protein